MPLKLPLAATSPIDSFFEVRADELEDKQSAAPDMVIHVVDTVDYRTKWSNARVAAQSGDSQQLSIAHSYQSCAGLLDLKYLGMAPGDPEQHFGALALAFPHFRDLLTVFEDASYGALVRASQQLSGIRVLLLGPPGIGKTRVVHTLAESLSLGCEKLSINASVTSHELLGLAHTWGNPTPGLIAKLMSRSLTANPIVVLDEVDKGAVDMRQYGSSLNTLLELTEPSTAKTIHDQCLAVDIDLSRVSFIATANSTNSLSEPLLSRFQVIEVRAPSRSQMPAVLQSIYGEVLGNDAGVFDARLSTDLIESLLDDTPRAARRRLQAAVCHAAKRRVQSNLKSDQPIVVTPEDLPGRQEQIVRSIGFVPQAM